VKPEFVFGTPTYVLGERIVSLGNPALATLLNLLDTEAALATLERSPPRAGRVARRGGASGAGRRVRRADSVE
jgi:hypothetical protein